MDREEMINAALHAKEKKITPIKVYLIQTGEKSYLVNLGPRPPVVFDGDKPVDMDNIWEIVVQSPSP